MPKSGTVDDNMFPVAEKEAPKRGTQEDGSYIDSKGDVRPPREPRREPYPEPEELQEAGKTLTVESPDGATSFFAERMTEEQWVKAQRPARKRLPCMWAMREAYAGQPRPYYSYDEIHQIREGELKR